MSYSIMKQNDNTSPYVTEFVVDTVSDLSDLPTSVAPGSTCLIANSSQVYVLNNAREWVEL